MKARNVSWRTDAAIHPDRDPDLLHSQRHRNFATAAAPSAAQAAGDRNRGDLQFDVALFSAAQRQDGFLAGGAGGSRSAMVCLALFHTYILRIFFINIYF